MSLKSGWKHVSKKQPCPVCSHNNWCTVSTDGRVAHCQRENRGSFKPGKRGGWLHFLQAIDLTRPRERRPMRVMPAVAGGEEERPKRDFSPLTNLWASRIDYEDEGVAAFLQYLGLSADGMGRQEMGWARWKELEAESTVCTDSGMWTFPMRDGDDRVVGVRLRHPDEDKGVKYCVAGSDGSGLFVPRGLTPSGVLFFPEGPTSCGALLDLGFKAIGRPNCNAGFEYAAAWVKRLKPAVVICVGDNDAPLKSGVIPGHEGALALKRELSTFHPDVRHMFPREGFKDIRKWWQAGLCSRQLRQWCKLTKRREAVAA